MSGIKKRQNFARKENKSRRRQTGEISAVLPYVKRHTVTFYQSMVSDLRHLRAVHCVEHYPCLPDPQRVSGTEECGTVHYGFCVPVILDDEDEVIGSALSSGAKTPVRVDAVQLLSSPNLEGHLKSLVDHFVARDKATQAKSSKSRSQSPASPKSTAAAFNFSSSPIKPSVKQPQLNSASIAGLSAEEALGQLLLDMKASVRKDAESDAEGEGQEAGRRVNNGEISLQSPVDFAKKRFQLSQDVEAEKKLKAAVTRVPLNGIPHMVSEAKTKFENGMFNQMDIRWKSEWLPNPIPSQSPQPQQQQPQPANAVTLCETDVLSPTLAKYNFLLHPETGAISPRNKSPSSDSLTVSPQLPHPKLTSIQKQHIRERALSPPTVSGALASSGMQTVTGLGGFPVRPFLTKGSVAERVLIFERCPVLDRGANRTHQHHPSKPLFNTWKSNQNYATGAAGSDATPSVTGTAEGKQKNIAIQNSIQISPEVNHHHHQKTLIPTKDTNGHHRRPLQHHHRRPHHQLPCFYYPCGRPISTNEMESQLNRVAQVFARFDKQEVSKDQFGIVVKACELPLYCKMPLFTSAAGANKNYISANIFLEYWKRVLSICYDLASKFVHILSHGTRRHLLPDDFISLIQDLIDSHPGLTFLKEAEEFHSRYVQTVIARIYYSVNRSWSGRLSIPELRKSNFLQVLSLLEDEDDINQITEYFSYEHFYVIYCKFWELDKDHDLLIDRHDMSRHNDGAISSRMINRIFSGAVIRGEKHCKEDRLTYPEFVWFLLSEEDKRHPTSIEYWFRCMDLDGDGFLSMYELEYFYEEQLQRMEALGIEALPFQDCLCQMLDMIIPKVPGKISLSDLKRCKMTPIFFDTFFNLEKYLDHEQKDPFAFQKDQDGDLGSEQSDWNRFASQEYELLVAEEGAGDTDDMFYDDDYADELVVNLGNLTLDNKNNLRTSVPKKSTYSNDDDYADYAESDDYQY